MVVVFSKENDSEVIPHRYREADYYQKKIFILKMIILLFLIPLGIFLAQNENISRGNFCVACNKVEAQQIASMGYVSQ